MSLLNMYREIPASIALRTAFDNKSEKDEDDFLQIMILVQQAAEAGEIRACVENIPLSKVNQRHLEKLGYVIALGLGGKYYLHFDNEKFVSALQ